jgi:acetoin:2,6-dichlorophenolindophenol oxidoreductase subunit beta
MSTYLKSLQDGLKRLLREESRVVLIGEDIEDPYGGAFKVTKGLSAEFADRMYTTPISEAGIVGVGTGMALQGFYPIVEIMFGDFTMLVADQISSNISKLRWMYNDRIRIPLVIRTPMGGRRGYGPTHSQSLEKVFMGIPGIRIVAPSICHTPGELLFSAVKDEHPVLFIEFKIDYARELYTTQDGSGIWSMMSQEGGEYPTKRISATQFKDDQVTVLTYGGMVPFVLEAAEELARQKEIFVEIVVPSQLKPFRYEALKDSVSRTGRLVIVEEGTCSYGWGSEIAAAVSEKMFGMLNAPVRRIGAMDIPIPNTKILEDVVLPSKEQIIRAIDGVLV